MTVADSDFFAKQDLQAGMRQGLAFIKQFRSSRD